MPKSLIIHEHPEGRGFEKSNVSRRKFLGFAGIAAGLVVTVSSCDKNEIVGTANNSDDHYDFGSGDIGILNYAYALEQLEAAFYTQVIMSQYSGIRPSEAALITDVRDHEIAHREFFKNALGDAAIADLEFDFTSIDFGSRESVLMTAKTFEDLGVSAYNGAGRLIENPLYLTLAGQIVSVEARHAAYIRELLMTNSFADMTVVDENGLDVTRKPTEVLTLAAPFIKSAIDASKLPTY